MALDAQILLSILAHETSSGDISRTLRATPASYSLSLSDGTGANQAQVVWSDSRTIPAEAVEDIDLQSLSDDRGVVSFSAVKVLYIKNTHASVQIDIRQGVSLANSWDWIGYAADDGLGETVVPAGGCIMVAAPTAAGVSVADDRKIIRIVAAAGVTYEIILIGEGTVT